MSNWKDIIFKIWDGTEVKLELRPTVSYGILFGFKIAIPPTVYDEKGLDEQLEAFVYDVGIIYYYNPHTRGIDKLSLDRTVL